MGLLQAILEAVHGEDDRIGGQTLTKLRAPLTSTNTTSMAVESAIGFGYLTDDTTIAKLAVNGEIIQATGRVFAPGAMTFTGLTRGVDNSKVQAHAAGSIVYDVSGNRTAMDLVKRGFFVDTARLSDLDIVGHNLGLHRCNGLTEEQWRRIIKAVAYLPKQPVDAFRKILEAYYGNTTSFDVFERLITSPFKVFVRVDSDLATTPAGIRGRFILPGALPLLTTGLTAVATPAPIRMVSGVYAASMAALRGKRVGLTNYYSGGSFAGSTITLGSSPGAIGTEVLVDYVGYGSLNTISYHYLAPNETTVDASDRYPYLSGPLATLECLLDQVRPAGIKVDLGFRL